MKNHYRFLALMTSFVMVCAAPMSALCSEAAPVGETAAAAETETAEIEEPAAEGLTQEAEAAAEEAVEIEEEAVEETSNEVDIPDEDSAGISRMRTARIQKRSLPPGRKQLSLPSRKKRKPRP